MQQVVQETHRAAIPAVSDRVLRLNDVLKILAVSRSTLYRLFGSGELRSFKIGDRATGVLQSDVQAFLDRRTGVRHGR